MLARLDSEEPRFQERLCALLRRDSQGFDQADLQVQVANIVSAVRKRGDQALIELTSVHDHWDLNHGFGVKAQEMEQALASITVAQRKAMEFSVERIRNFHQRQLQASWKYEEADGTVMGQKVTPIRRVGLYVPGGKAAYPSSVLMNAIPAKVAGVKELIMVTPTPHGKINALVLAAARIAGIDRIFRIGGAQAIAALAYGTETVPRVDKIAGPGNAWVAAAKQQVFGQVGIDMIAGPSEVLIIADATAQPDWVAMDLFAQAEHDEQAQAILLTLDADFATAVTTSIERLLPSMERRRIIATSLAKNGAVVLASTQKQIVAIANTIAAEHLEIFTANADELADEIDNAGAIFVGQHSAEVLGDYCVGPSHVLPTSGTARFSSALGVYDFQKKTSLIKVSPVGADAMAKHASVLAKGESLCAHAKAARLRYKNK